MQTKRTKAVLSRTKMREIRMESRPILLCKTTHRKKQNIYGTDRGLKEKKN